MRKVHIVFKFDSFSWCKCVDSCAESLEHQPQSVFAITGPKFGLLCQQVILCSVDEFYPGDTGGSLYDGRKQVLYWADVSTEVACVVPSPDTYQPPGRRSSLDSSTGIQTTPLLTPDRNETYDRKRSSRSEFYPQIQWLERNLLLKKSQNEKCE